MAAPAVSANRSAAARARLGVAAAFFTYGFVVGAWAPHIPFVVERLSIGVGLLGTLLLAIAVGAVAAMPFTGAAIGRFGSAPVMIGAGVAVAATLAPPVFAPSIGAFVVALFLFGVARGTLDVSMNAHGVAVERAHGRPVMSMFHGMGSFGGFIGAGLGAALPLRDVAAWHIGCVVMIGLAAMVIAWSRALPAATDRARVAGPAFALPSRRTIGIGAMAFAAVMVEGAMLDWSALHLKAAHTDWAARAGAGFAAFSGAMASARFVGDRLRARFGAVRLARVSASAACLGLLVAAFAPPFAVAVAGYALAGFGLANIVPILFAGGARLDPDSPGRGIAAVTMMGYAGLLAGPPLIGAVASIAGLPVAIGMLALAAGFVALGAERLAVLEP